MTDLKQLVNAWADRPEIGRRIVAFGSSNTAFRINDFGRYNWTCWLTLWLREQIGKHVSLTNTGIGGETVLNLLARFDRDVLPLRPDIVIITIGGNDHTHVKLKDYRMKLKQLVREFTGRDILVALQTYYSSLEEGGVNGPFDDYMAAVVDVANECDVLCIDNYAILRPWHRREPDQYKKLMHDNWHLNPLGHAIFGTLTCRAFGLSDPEMPADIAEEVAAILGRL